MVIEQSHKRAQNHKRGNQLKELQTNRDWYFGDVASRFEAPGARVDRECDDVVGVLIGY